LISCGTQKRNEGLAELQRVQSTVHEMSVVVTVGANQPEFSRRLTDVLLKIGDIQQSEQQCAAKFPKNEHQAVEDTYRHLVRALDAYNQSKDFLAMSIRNSWTPLTVTTSLGRNGMTLSRRHFRAYKNSK